MMDVPPWAPAETKEKTIGNQIQSMHIIGGGELWSSCDQDLVDGKPDGKKSSPLVALHPPSFLHQSHDEGAGPLAVLEVVVLLVQL